MQGDDALQFFVDLVCYEADADVRLNAFLREVEYRPCLQIALRDTECPFHVPKTVILGYYLLGIKVSVGYVAFQAVPLGIVLYFLLVDDHLHVLADGKELVISASVDGCLGKHSAAVCLTQPLNAFLAVMSVFLGPLL